LKEASNISSTMSPVVTFWEGEIIDCKAYFFWTKKWNATKSHDYDHWKKFKPFSKNDSKYYFIISLLISFQISNSLLQNI